MEPFVVTARLAHGIAHAAPWTTTLDGLLAAELWADRKAAARDLGDEVPDLDPHREPPDLDLPLARCERGDAQEWHWAATCGYPEPGAGEEVRTWTGRVDQGSLGQLAEWLPAVVSERQGPYRSRHMPLLVTLTRTLIWRGVGDLAAVRRVLEPVAAIGKKRSQGEGRVLAWEFSAAPDLDPWTAGHLHPDGTLGRPCPDGCLAGAVPCPATGGFGVTGIRPPYIHPLRQVGQHLPYASA